MTLNHQVASLELSRREIKFRAWDKDHKQFIYLDLNNPDEDLFGRHGYLNNNLPNPEWKQFTGVLDKNKKEIYEGDILCDRQYQTDKPILFREVVFGEFGVSTEPSSGYKDVYGWGMKDKYDTEAIDISLEVIGNIYENHLISTGEKEK